MLTTLTQQQNGRRIGRYVPTSKTYRWGSKTGSNRGVINDVGFVESPIGTMVIALYSLKLGDRITGRMRALRDYQDRDASDGHNLSKSVKRR